MYSNYINRKLKTCSTRLDTHVNQISRDFVQNYQKSVLP